METTQKQRIKIFIDFLLQNGEIEKYADFGEKLGITNKSRLSQLISGTVNNESFINRLLIQWPDLNREWIMSGEGQMLNNSPNSGIIINDAGHDNFFTPSEKSDESELVKHLRDEVDYLRNLVNTLTSKQ